MCALVQRCLAATIGAHELTKISITPSEEIRLIARPARHGTAPRCTTPTRAFQALLLLGLDVIEESLPPLANRG
jgi:hypothetical protein